MCIYIYIYTLGICAGASNGKSDDDNEVIMIIKMTMMMMMMMMIIIWRLNTAYIMPPVQFTTDFIPNR